ncbi:beta-lactamase/transpeptidase-like protein [Polychytrium aggregatum]|uniref:beta-lactamase/transpeptidase-like protein n=1 Tax=Polychytrium aggregatum TaxID=110093 RepID=UPI0022FE52C1|nr:beta-lactamase/transpeptidase-like protein [Polychytrium aggregatum]KAI9205776.1 beta-lactamase/transpeptidase-like protein [Polychytrium aggregatum]
MSLPTFHSASSLASLFSAESLHSTPSSPLASLQNSPRSFHSRSLHPSQTDLQQQLSLSSLPPLPPSALSQPDPDPLATATSLSFGPPGSPLAARPRSISVTPLSPQSPTSPDNTRRYNRLHSLRFRWVRRLRRLALWIVLIALVNYRYWAGRPQVPLTCNLFSWNCPVWPIQGSIAEGYESVLEMFKKNFEEGWEVGASFAAYVDGEPVVELYGGFHDRRYKRQYDNTSLQLVFSSSKVMEGVVMTYLVDQGWIDFDDRISKYWPEFAQGNKENVTLRALLGHRGGVAYLDRQPTLKELSDLDRMATLLASQPHNFDGSEVQGYHAVTRGWYLNEVARRVDPKHRTIGQIIREEIMPALDIEFYLGLPRDKEARVSPLIGYPTLRAIAKIVVPNRMQRNPPPPFLKSALFNRKSVSYRAIAGSNPRQIRPWPHSHNRREIWASEGPSFSGITNVRSLVRLAAMMSNHGTLGKTQLIRPSTIKRALQALPTQMDAVALRNVTFATGGWGVHVTFPGAPGVWTGWGGAGGSMVWWNHETGVAFSYVMNSMAFTSMGDRRSWRLVKALVESVERLRAAQAQGTGASPASSTDQSTARADSKMLVDGHSGLHVQKIASKASSSRGGVLDGSPQNWCYPYQPHVWLVAECLVEADDNLNDEDDGSWIPESRFGGGVWSEGEPAEWED